jgi:hypothetical protein
LRLVVYRAAITAVHADAAGDDHRNLILGSGRPIWNNDGDTATLVDPHNIVVSRYR